MESLVSRKRIAVLVPGILGSTLEDKSGGWIWSENFYDNYKVLLNNPGLLSWKGIKADARLIKNIRFGYFDVVSLWAAIYNDVSFPPDFDSPPSIIAVGYDWRQSNVDSANDLAELLAKTVGSPVTTPPSSNEERRVTFIMHSMGGLVVRIAVARNLIHPGWIDRLIHIGSPLYGAQSAFGTLFGSGEILPLLSLLVTARRLKNQALFLDYLQRCIKTCPSIYELLPRRQIPYLHYSAVSRTNPLNEDRLDAKLKGYASDTHALLDQASDMLKKMNIPSFTIYTDVHPSHKTEIEFRVESQKLGYKVIEITGTTSYGDGTVPAESARGDLAFDRPSPVFGAAHATMCKDRNVGAIVQSVL